MKVETITPILTISFKAYYFYHDNLYQNTRILQFIRII
jgi:hypothetical protein